MTDRSPLLSCIKVLFINIEQFFNALKYQKNKNKLCAWNLYIYIFLVRVQIWNPVDQSDIMDILRSSLIKDPGYLLFGHLAEDKIFMKLNVYLMQLLIELFSFR